MAIFDSGMNLAGEQVDPRQQAQRPETLVFMVARDAGMLARDRRQVRRRVGDRLDARLLVIGDVCNVGLASSIAAVSASPATLAAWLPPHAI